MRNFNSSAPECLATVNASLPCWSGRLEGIKGREAFGVTLSELHLLSPKRLSLRRLLLSRPSLLPMFLGSSTMPTGSPGSVIPMEIGLLPRTSYEAPAPPASSAMAQSAAQPASFNFPPTLSGHPLMKDVTKLLDYVEKHLPLGQKGWKAIQSDFGKWATESGCPERDVKSLETKYKLLLKTKKPTVRQWASSLSLY
ncbi:hypothetical protein MVEN_00041000 [Mycena venus]|uniref:Uncharacterized protein n=1 Tax=Mycena venus TaxID=2733690 RepID=A0A8H6Z6V6_9AGAR|nr:hypothetical protein MVEN_00041000 [Mycena venus]